MCKYEIIHKTGNNGMQRIITAIGNTHKKFGEDQMCSSGDMIAGWSKKIYPSHWWHNK